MGEDSLFNVAIATIFAREFLEGAIIIGNYRTCIIKNDAFDEDQKKQRLRAVTYATIFATILAIVVVLAVAIPLGILSQDLDERTVEIIEGVSKIVAAVCILQLSLKIPVWLGIYRKVSIIPFKKNIVKWCNGSLNEDEMKTDKTDEQLTLSEIRFNVAWNLWREVAECGIFLIPFFLGTGAKAIPLSAVVGIAIALIIGIGLYVANQRMNNKASLAVTMSGVTLFLSVGLFVGGCHEFEEVLGETRDVWEAENEFWSDKVNSS
jgi:high-affinity iron transporter